MATPDSNTVPFSNVALNGTNSIDSLVFGTKWGGGLGTGVTLDYSFPAADASWRSDYFGDFPENGYAPLGAAEQAAALAAMQRWANVANVQFSLVAETAGTVGEVRFAYSSAVPGGSQALSFLPLGSPEAGDVWFSPAADWSNLNPGRPAHNALMHELGHVLGLKHPFETSATSSATLPSTEDGLAFTVMSYSVLPGQLNSASSFLPTTVMRYDIAAAQYLYGANMAFHAGNDTYTYVQGQDYLETIWDAGGRDTIVWSATTAPGVIDLTPGAWSDLGNDIFYQDSLGATFFDGDTVAIYDTVTIENATGGDAADRLVGNAVANVLKGGGGNDTIEGHGGNDTLTGGTGVDSMTGGAGSDRYEVRQAGDLVVETDATAAGGTDLVDSYLAAYTLTANVENGRIRSSGTASLTGNARNNLLYAGNGNNTLDGVTGSDTASYQYATASVTVSLAVAGGQATGGSGTDTLQNIDHLTGSDHDDTLIGSGGSNRLTGREGDDSMDGGTGNDTMVGGDGDDTYRVRDAGDLVSESSSTAAGGTDQVYSHLAAYTLPTNVENGRIAATGAANLTGNTRNNLVYAGIGNNVIDGVTGVDTVSYAQGLSGTQGVTVSLLVTTAQATGGSGTDTLLNIDNLRGSTKHDNLTGNDGSNQLEGWLGNDLLKGGGGNDTLGGGDGNDTLSGGSGRDSLTGGAGNDVFDFDSASDTGVSDTTRDVIADFVAASDSIDLSGIDADATVAGNQAFTGLVAGAFTAPRQLGFSGGVLSGNVDADADAEFAIQLTGVATLSFASIVA